MRWLNTVLIVYAVFMILVGVQAAFLPFEGDKASMISFYAGAGIGLLMLGTVALSFTNPRPARIGALVLCVFVLGRFLPSYIAHPDRFYPAGLLTLVTFAVAGCLAAGHFMGMLARRERGRETLAPFAESQLREREESRARREEPKA